MSEIATSPSANLSDTEPETPNSRVRNTFFYLIYVLVYFLRFIPANFLDVAKSALKKLNKYTVKNAIILPSACTLRKCSQKLSFVKLYLSFVYPRLGVMDDED